MRNEKFPADFADERGFLNFISNEFRRVKTVLQSAKIRVICGKFLIHISYFLIKS